jgi:hypothetical protein
MSTPENLDMDDVVHPQSWTLALMLHGPRGNRSRFLLTMMVLSTWMEDYEGEILPAAPTLQKWAECTRLSMRTIRQHIRIAEREGWLIVDSRCDPPQYRCSLPPRLAGRKFHMRLYHERRLPNGRIIEIEPAIVSRPSLSRGATNG